MLRIQVPASTANLGPGFDSLGMALEITNTFLIEKSHEQTYISQGEGQEMQIELEDNLFFKAYHYLFTYSGESCVNIKVTAKANIPLSRGLGSSGVVIIAGLLAASYFLKTPPTKDELINIAVELEGHPDNTLPSLLGGLLLCYRDKIGALKRCHLPLPDLKVIVAIPSLTLATKKARKILPSTISREDAIFTMQHLALLIHALHSKNYSLLSEALDDRLHQPYRQKLIPGFKRVISRATMAGALGLALSGSGPSIIAFSREGDEEKIGQAMVLAFEEEGIKAERLITSPRREGALVLE